MKIRTEAEQDREAVYALEPMPGALSDKAGKMCYHKAFNEL